MSEHQCAYPESFLEVSTDVVVVKDCLNSSGTQALIRREYLDRAVVDEPGNAFWSGYQHNYADTEMFDPWWDTVKSKDEWQPFPIFIPVDE